MFVILMVSGCYLVHLLIVFGKRLVVARPKVVLVGVTLLLGLRQTIHLHHNHQAVCDVAILTEADQIVSGLVGDVGEDSVHKRFVSLQLVLYRVPGRGVHILIYL